MVFFYGLLAIIAGAMIIVSSTLNAQIGKRHGIYTAAFINNLLAALISGAIVVILYGGLGFEPRVMNVVPRWAFLGGVAAIVIVVGSNAIIPRMPIVYTSLLVFIGQFTVGLLMDLLSGRAISVGKFFGFLLILGGLLYNFYVDSLEY